jgi:hypothetical protein
MKIILDYQLCIQVYGIEEIIGNNLPAGQNLLLESQSPNSKEKNIPGKKIISFYKIKK